MSVLILVKTLSCQPKPPRVASLEVVPLDASTDVDEWLTLHQRAFLGGNPPVRPWNQADFEREFAPGLSGSGRVAWLARDPAGDPAVACGAVSVTPSRMPGRPASVHWLMVDPDRRGRGIGSLLLATAERYAWEQGCREVRLETHCNWRAAVRFFTRHGYK